MTGLSESEVDDLDAACEGNGEYLCCYRTTHRTTGEPVGGRMLDAVERTLAARLADLERRLLSHPGVWLSVGEALAIIRGADPATREGCPTCTGPHRETTGLVCQSCGRDFGQAT